MKQNKFSKLTFVVVLTAVVAALTTIVVLLLRAKAKKEALCRCNDPFDCDLDGCEYCFDCEEEGEPLPEEEPGE